MEVSLYTTVRFFQNNQSGMGVLNFFSFPLNLYLKFEKIHLGLDSSAQCKSFLSAPTVVLAVKLPMAS